MSPRDDVGHAGFEAAHDLRKLRVESGAGTEQHKERVLAFGDETEVGVEALLDLITWAGCGGSSGQDGLLELAAHVAEQLDEQLALRAEVLIEHRLCDPGRLGDLVHRRATEPVLGERRQGAVQQLSATFGCGQAHGHGATFGADPPIGSAPNDGTGPFGAGTGCVGYL